jgi:protein-L-isoaspartate(D-aspartate) O-methyltransferase
LKRKINRQRLLDKRGMPDLPDARARLVAALGKREGLSRASLEALAEVPRHAFAPRLLWRMAYMDTELWTPTSFLPRPGVVARMATALVEADARKVLEYATGTGYVTAVLAMLADRVDTVEHDPWQLWFSSDAFRELELLNISQKVSDGYLGWRERAPYDGIVVCAAMPRIPRVMIEQLVEGGVCIAPVRAYYGPHRLIQVVKSSDEGTSVSDLGPCFFPPLAGVWTPMYLGWGGDLEPEHFGVRSAWGDAVRTDDRGLAFG